MHNFHIFALERAAQEAINAQNPQIFLSRFAGNYDSGDRPAIHYYWHYVAVPHSLGFLLFHWHAVENFKNVGLDKAMNISPYKIDDFRRGGRFYRPETGWDEMMGNALQQAQSLDDLATFSGQLEDWHNPTHNTLEIVTGEPMNDAATNVLFSTFWNFHFFINNLFEEQLFNYGKSEQPQLQTAAQIIQYIETEQNHMILRFI